MRMDPRLGARLASPSLNQVTFASSSLVVVTLQYNASVSPRDTIASSGSAVKKSGGPGGTSAADSA